MRSTSRFLTLAAIACIAAVSSFGSSAARVVRAVAATAAYVVGLTSRYFVGYFLAPKSKSQAEAKPRVALVAAKGFVAKLLQRSRPQVTPRWRMCPSA